MESMFSLRGRSKFIFCSLRRLVGQIKGKLFAYAPMNNDFSPSLHRARMHKSFLAREYSLKYSILSTLALSATRAAMHVCSKLRNVVGCRNYLFFFLRRYRVRIIFWMIYTMWRCWQHALYRMHVLRVEVPLNILRTCALLRGPCTIATVVVLLSNGLRVVWSYKISPSVCARMLVCCVAFSWPYSR